MSSAYDNFDYFSYWKEREYENDSEKLALRRLLAEIPKINTLLEIGAGYGRLTDTYGHRAKKLILTDPSGTHLRRAKNRVMHKNVKFLQVKMESLPKKVKSGSVDLVIVVRVIHHIENVDLLFEVIVKLLKKNGHLILEFANKDHFKAQITELFKGNFTFPFEIFPKNMGEGKDNLPFKNFHPDDLAFRLQKSGFEIKSKLSVSNFRSTRIKNLIPRDTLNFFESLLQKPLAYVNFGPSIFYLLKKI